MPCELSLAPDPDRGGHRYRAELSGELEPTAIRKLSEWLSDAKQNPDASFLIDLSETTRTAPRARLEMRALLRRHDDLRAARRLTIVERGRFRRRAAAGAVGPGAAPGVLEPALGVADATALPF